MGQQDTMTVEEFQDSLDSISADVLATHLILMEELCTTRKEVFDLDKETKRFFSRRQEAVRVLLSERKRQSEILRTVLDRRKQAESSSQ